MVMKSRCFTYSIEAVGFLSRILRKLRRTLLSFAEDYAEVGVYKSINGRVLFVIMIYNFIK